MTISMQIKTDVTWFFPQIFVSSRDIDDQILQSDWLRAFYVIENKIFLRIPYFGGTFGLFLVRVFLKNSALF